MFLGEEAQIENYVPDIFRSINCFSENHQSSGIGLCIIFHRYISLGNNTVEETMYQNSIYQYTSDDSDFIARSIFSEYIFLRD